MICEKRPPKNLVGDLVGAERTSFDPSVISDHFQNWLEEQGIQGMRGRSSGQRPITATECISLMTYVTWPIIHFQPAVVAQKAATVALLSDGASR
jgi:alkanesulfonate monooxygenase SsuD/methylene tetrahydromethanopterin reductase-like flavin-dependent oxidoreductase (luciferase family)